MAMTQEQLMVIVESAVQQRLAAAGFNGGTNDRTGGFGRRRNQEKDFRRVDKFSGGEDEWKASEFDFKVSARAADAILVEAMGVSAEVEEHEETHLPFRSWCCHCVRGKGKQAEHRRLTQEEVGPELRMDFAFMGDEESEELLTIWVAKERTTRMLMSTVVQAQSSAEFAAKRTLAFLREIGCELVAFTVKSDN